LPAILSFSLTLAVLLLTFAAMSAPSHSQPPAEATELEIKNILLVDDDEALANTLKELLESRNFIVTTASNGAEALREVLAFDFDVIICDMLMPKMPGDMFYLAVQKSKPEMAKRFLFVTGHADNPKVESFLKSIDGLVIFKPVLTEELVRMISFVLNRTSHQEE
jgi:DNA-binding response OmpR family regulator